MLEYASAAAHSFQPNVRVNSVNDKRGDAKQISYCTHFYVYYIKHIHITGARIQDGDTSNELTM